MKKQMIWIGLAACGCALALWRLEFIEEHKRGASMTASGTEEQSGSAVTATTGDLGNPASLPSISSGARGGVQGEEPLVGEALMKATREEIFKEAPHLQEFKYIANKGLPSEQDYARLGEMLRDSNQIQLSKAELLSVPAGEITAKVQLRRAYELDMLSAATSWTLNPARGQALAAIEEVLLVPYPKSENKALLRTIAAEKIELYQLIRKAEPALAGAIHDKTKGTLLGRLFAAPPVMMSNSHS